MSAPPAEQVLVYLALERPELLLSNNGIRFQDADLELVWRTARDLIASDEPYSRGEVGVRLAQRGRGELSPLVVHSVGAWPDPLPTRPADAPLPTYGFDDLHELPAVRYEIDGSLQHGEASLLYGSRGSAKSLVALDRALHLASGIPWQGRAVQQRHVLYVCLENTHAMPGRMRAWRRNHDADPGDHFRFTTVRLRATDPGDVHRLKATLKDHPEPPDLIIDTQQRFEAGLDENLAKDMQRLVDVLDSIRDERLASAVEMVHHSGKDASRGARGNSLLEASYTCVSRVDKQGRLVRLTAEKVNNDEEGWTVAWQIAFDPEASQRGAPWLLPAITGGDVAAVPDDDKLKVVLALANIDGHAGSKSTISGRMGIGRGRAFAAISAAAADFRFPVVFDPYSGTYTLGLEP